MFGLILLITNSGFFISEDGLAITNHHVVENSQKIKISTKGGFCAFLKEKNQFALMCELVDAIAPVLQHWGFRLFPILGIIFFAYRHYSLCNLSSCLHA